MWGPSRVEEAVNDLGINRVFVTVDHGFLYTRRPLKEHDKIAKADIGSGDVQLHRRHILSREAIDSNILVKMNMEDIYGGEYYGLALRECIRLKSVAGNKNYAHGGVSLQKMCVPVIEFRNHRSNSKVRVDQEKVTLSLVSTSRRITSSMFHVDLFQREPVSGKVLPCEYELCLTDGSGNPVTDIQKAHADMATPDERARVSRSIFTLKAGIDIRLTSAISWCAGIRRQVRSPGKNSSPSTWPSRLRSISKCGYNVWAGR